MLETAPLISIGDYVYIPVIDCYGKCTDIKEQYRLADQTLLEIVVISYRMLLINGRQQEYYVLRSRHDDRFGPSPTKVTEAQLHAARLHGKLSSEDYHWLLTL